MRKATLLVISVGLIAVAAALQSDNLKPDIVAETTWRSAEGVKFEVVAVCDVKPESVTCWNPDGIRDQELEPLVLAYFCSPNGLAQFVIGRKNRYIILKVAGSKESFTNYKAVDQSYLIGRQFGSEEGSGMYIISVACKRDAKTCPIRFEYETAGPEPLLMGFAVGKKGIYGSQELTLYKVTGGKVEPDPMKKALTPPNSWNLYYEYVGMPEEACKLKCEPLDRKGKPIVYVDRQGEPVSAVVFHSENRPVEGPKDVEREMVFTYATFRFNWGSSIGAATATTNINPDRIGSVRISGTRTLLIELTKIPLDPKT